MALSTIPFSGLGADASNQGVNFRNLIINGDMSIAQRGTSSSSLSGYTSCDRFTATNNNLDQLAGTLSQVSDAPSGLGLSKSFKFTVTTPETTLDADEYLTIQHRIEGQNLQHLKFNTSSAESLTLSFWVKSAVTGTYPVGLYLIDNNRNIGNTYTINSANTWEKKTLTFVGDTIGSIDNDNTEGLRLWFILGAGSTFSNSNNTTWDTYSSGRLGYGVSSNLLTTSSATWQVTGVQLEVGTSASDFEFLPYDVNLQRCQRYLYRMGGVANKYKRLGIHITNANNRNQTAGHFYLPVMMRAEPTVTVSGTVFGGYLGGASSYNSFGGSMEDANFSKNLNVLRFSGELSSNVGQHCVVTDIQYSSTGYMEADAEL